MDSAMRRGCTGGYHCCLLREAVSWKITDSFAFVELEEGWAIIYLNLINRSALKVAVHFPGRHSQDASSAPGVVQVEISELRPLCSWPPSIPPPPKLRVDQKIFFGSLATRPSLLITESCTHDGVGVIDCKALIRDSLRLDAVEVAVVVLRTLSSESLHRKKFEQFYTVSSTPQRFQLQQQYTSWLFEHSSQAE